LLRYLQHYEIDKSKWDSCVLNSHNSLIYAHSFYLDNCTNKEWHAIVLNDYEAVMPLTFRIKYKIKYLYQPAFLQQAGIFSHKKITEEKVKAFLLTVTKHFRFAEINLNYANYFSSFEKITSVELTNYLLPLNRKYTEIAEQYKDNFSKNIKRATKSNFEYYEDENIDALVEFYKKLYHARFTNITNEDYQALKLNCAHLQKNKNLVLRKAMLGNELLACVVLLKDENRLYNVASSITMEGKKLRANYFLYDKIIQEFSDSNLTLDFEGSDIKGIADFYKSTQPAYEKYYSLKFNNLPALIKLFKK
jgi:hypothetical protein